MPLQVLNMTHFLIPSGMKKMACFELCFTCTDDKSRNLEFSQLTDIE